MRAIVIVLSTIATIEKTVLGVQVPGISVFISLIKLIKI